MCAGALPFNVAPTHANRSSWHTSCRPGSSPVVPVQCVLPSGVDQRSSQAAAHHELHGNQQQAVLHGRHPYSTTSQLDHGSSAVADAQLDSSTGKQQQQSVLAQSTRKGSARLKATHVHSHAKDGHYPRVHAALEQRDLVPKRLGVCTWRHRKHLHSIGWSEAVAFCRPVVLWSPDPTAAVAVKAMIAQPRGALLSSAPTMQQAAPHAQCLSLRACTHCAGRPAARPPRSSSHLHCNVRACMQLGQVDHTMRPLPQLD